MTICTKCKSSIEDKASYCPFCGEPTGMCAEPDDFTYEAFISYRHLPLSSRIAKRLQHDLEGFPIPKGMHGIGGGKRLGRLFRDEDELPASTSLSDQIRDAIARSRFLIVICTPETKESRWVELEVELFASLHGRDHVLVALAEGERTRCLPNILLYRKVVDTDGSVIEEPTEPLAADFRTSSGKSRRLETLRIVAALLGCSFDDLRQRERSRRLRAAAVMAVMALTVALVFGGVFLYQRGQIHQRQADLSLSRARWAAARADRMLASGDRMGAIRIALSALASTEDGRRCYEAQASLERATQVYPTEHDWLPLYRIESEGTIEALAVNEESGTFAAIDSSGSLAVYQLDSSNLVHSIPLPSKDQGGLGIEGEPVRWKLSCCGDAYIAFAVGEQSLGLYSASSGALLWKYDDIPEGIGSISTSADGKKVCVTGVDYFGGDFAWAGTVHMIDALSGMCLWRMTIPLEDFSITRSVVGGRDDSVCASFGDTLAFINGTGTDMVTASLSMPWVYDIAWEGDTALVVEVTDTEPGMPCVIEAFDCRSGQLLWSNDVEYPVWAVNGIGISQTAEFYGTVPTAGGPRIACGIGSKLLLVSETDGSVDTLGVYDSPICGVSAVEGRMGSWLRVCTVYEGVSEVATEGLVLGQERSGITADPTALACFATSRDKDYLVTMPFDDYTSHNAVCIYHLGVPLEERFAQPTEDVSSFVAGSSFAPTEGELSSLQDALDRSGYSEPFEVVAVSTNHDTAVVQFQDSFACVRLLDGQVTHTIEGSFGHVKNAGFAKGDTLFFVQCTTSNRLNNERLYVFDLGGDYLAPQSAIAFGEAISADGRSVLVHTVSTSYVLPYLSTDDVAALGRNILSDAGGCDG